MNILVDDSELLKYIKIWNKIESLFNKIAFNKVAPNKKGFHSKPVYNEYIKTKIISYNGNFHDFKKLTKNEYCDHSVLLLESISEVKNKYYLQKFLHRFFESSSIECNSIEYNNNKSSLFKELVQIVDWSDDEANDKFENLNALQFSCL